MKKTKFLQTRAARTTLIVLAALLALTVLLSGCSGNASEQTAQDAAEKYGSTTMKLYIPGEYLGKNVISNFEKQFGVHVIIEYFDSNEMMYTKLQAGDAYDVLVPSDYMIERLIEMDMLQPLDLEKIPNKELLAEQVKNLPFDPDNTYSIPYFWGSVGLVYNENNVDPAEVEEQGWSILKNPKYAGHIFVYDSERDAFLMPFKALGYSANTSDPAEIEEAYQWLLELNDTMEPAYVTDEVIDGMISGNKDIAVVYSGDAAVILDENEEMRFSMPKEGTNIWFDSMVIPANAENPALAHEFINYMLTYDAAYDNAETVGYSSPNAEVLDLMSTSEDLYGENEAYLPRSGYALDEVYSDNPILKKMISELWIKVKAS
ncbi:MAG: ABC transporter substrate-binding protein [Oscillospiraceae bacterium]|nr:ABC transporter substrate-binding protein [Oscillospiraceae bacterium]